MKKNDHYRIKAGIPNRTSIVVQNAKFDSTVLLMQTILRYTPCFLNWDFETISVTLKTYYHTFDRISSLWPRTFLFSPLGGISVVNSGTRVLNMIQNLPLPSLSLTFSLCCKDT